MHIKFLTLAELAEAAGFTAAVSDMFFTELVNDPHSLVRPYVMTTEGIPMPIGRQALGATYYFKQDDVRVKEDDVDECVKMRARVISAKPADDAPTVADANFVPDDFKPPPMSTSCRTTTTRTTRAGSNHRNVARDRPARIEKVAKHHTASATTASKRRAAS